MSDKNIEDKQNNQPETSPEATKPIKPGKVFKDSPLPESERVIQSDNEVIENNLSARKTRSKKADANQTSAVELVEPTVEEPVEMVKPKKVRHGKWVWLGILILLVLIAIGSGVGYWQAMNLRLQKETSQRIELATTQYVMAEQDQISGNLVMARQRLEYVLKIYPAYPGLADKLAQVMLQISLNKPQTAAQTTPEPAVTSVPTKDTTVLSELFTQAQNQLTAADWPGLLGTVNKMRNIDPSYKPIQVDGMYYYALRYNGIAQIKAGAFEVGMYYLAMAEQIAPLDENDKSEVTSWQNWAKMYQIAGSWYGVNWQKSSDLFSALSQQVPYMVDINGVTTKQRYVNSMIGIGDNLMAVFDYCNAENQYKIANGILSNDKLIAKIQTADQDCANPPATPTPTEDPNAPKPTKIPTPSGE